MATQFTKETLLLTLKSMGYGNIKLLSSTRFAVLTNENRVKALEKIQKGIPGSIYDSNPSSVSSVGMVKINNFNVLAKPASRQGAASAGVGNENLLVDTINNYTKTGPINVIFKGYNKSYKIVGCKGAKSVGADTAGRKKADVVLFDKKNNNYPISIKKDDAETWESADSYFSNEARRILIETIDVGKAKLLPQEGNYFMIEPNIAVKAKDSEKKDVVFGSDILNDGAVITKTFNSNSFKLDDSGNLVIDVSHIITDMSDVKGDKDVYFLIRNDKTRKSIKDFPGIRILAAYKKRINKNVLVVDR